MSFGYSDFPSESTLYVGTNPGMMIPVPLQNGTGIKESTDASWTFQQTVTGRVHAQRRRFSRRTWSVDPGSLPDTCYRALRALTTGGFGNGPMLFSTPQMRAGNMVTLDDSTFMSDVNLANLDSGNGVTNTGAQRLDFQFIPGSIRFGIRPVNVSVYLTVSENFPAFAGKTYTVSAWVKGHDSHVRLAFFDSTIGVIDYLDTGSQDYPGWTRVSATGMAPAGTVGAYVDGEFDQLAGVQVTETTGPVPYAPGMGCAKAVIDVPDWEHGQYTADGFWSTPSITVREVG